MNDIAMRPRRAAPPQDGVRSRLAASTKAMHLRLHESAAFAGLMRGHLDRAGYVRLLQHLHGLHALADSRIAPFDDHPALAWRRRSPADRPSLLRDDLASFGQAPMPDQALAGSLRRFDTAIEALGCAWVIEGSSLGGRVMAGMAERLLGGRSGIAFFQGSVTQGERWRACCDAIEAFGGQSGNFAIMENAAAHTFAAFESFLCAPRPP
jgi:heme oxygenase